MFDFCSISVFVPKIISVTITVLLAGNQYFPFLFYFTLTKLSLLVVLYFYLLANTSVLFRVVVSCKTVNSLIKFKLFNKIAVIHEKFLVPFNKLRGPDKTPATCCASLL